MTTLTNHRVIACWELRASEQADRGQLGHSGQAEHGGGTLRPLAQTSRVPTARTVTGAVPVTVQLLAAAGMVGRIPAGHKIGLTGRAPRATRESP